MGWISGFLCVVKKISPPCTNSCLGQIQYDSQFIFLCGMNTSILILQGDYFDYDGPNQWHVVCNGILVDGVIGSFFFSIVHRLSLWCPYLLNSDSWLCRIAFKRQPIDIEIVSGIDLVQPIFFFHALFLAISDNSPISYTDWFD